MLTVSCKCIVTIMTLRLCRPWYILIQSLPVDESLVTDSLIVVGPDRVMRKSLQGAG